MPRLAFLGGLAMVRGMSTAAPVITSARLIDASVVARVLDIAGARHEVLPPRMTVSGGVLLFRRAPRFPPP